MVKKIQASGSAVIYARFSSHSQRDVSIEQQIKACMDYADQTNLEVIGTYSDAAVSGTTDRRPQFQRMMREAEKGRFGFVIAWKSNRMGRNMLQAMVNESRLMEQGIRCLYVEEDFDDTAAGRFALRNMMNVNQFYSENMAEDITRGLMDNARKCKVNNICPYGYRRGEDGRFEVDPKEAPIVQEIFERFMDGDSFTEIANDLNARGYKTRRGNLWNKGSFHRMLRNERYIGVYEYSGIRNENGVPAILRKELFLAVQNKLTTKSNPQGRHRENGDYLLTGKLKCGHCGSFMVGMSGTGKSGKKHYYYTCQKKRTEHACDKKTVARDWIEQLVVEVTRDYIIQDSVIDWIVDGWDKFIRSNPLDDALLNYKEELAQVEKGIQNVMTAIEQGIITSTTKNRLLDLEDQKKRLEITIAAEEAARPDITRDQVQFWLESFRDGKVTSKKYQAKIIDVFVQSVYLFDDEIRIVFNYSGKSSITVSFSEITAIESSKGIVGSFNLPSAPPDVLRSNTCFFYGGFAIRVDFDPKRK